MTQREIESFCFKTIFQKECWRQCYPNEKSWCQLKDPRYKDDHEDEEGESPGVLTCTKDSDCDLPIKSAQSVCMKYGSEMCFAFEDPPF